jgi:hypothetical protein
VCICACADCLHARPAVPPSGQAAFLEEHLNVGVNFLLSAEIDHAKKDYKFGFGMTIGE